MAIASIRNSFSAGAFKLGFPRRLRTRQKLEISPPAIFGSGGGGAGADCTNKDEFWKVFRYFDTNNDGKISAVEIRDYFASVGDSVSNEEAEKIIREFGRGSDGSLRLEFGEFVRMMESRDGDDDSAILRRVFEVYEVDKGSGFITAEGLRCVLRRLGDVKSREECEAMIRVFDLDGNGVLDFHEFQKMMS